MGVISRKRVVRRLPTRCCTCDRRIPEKTECVRLYGSATNSEPRYVIYECLNCTDARATTEASR